MTRDTCRRPTCDNTPRGSNHDDVTDAFSARFCSTPCELKYDHVRDDRPERSEPADFGGGESTGVQEL